MTNNQGTPPTTSILSLLWGVPIAVCLGLASWIVALFAWCGDDRGGCRGDSLSLIVEDSLSAAVWLSAGGLATGAVLYGVPWTAGRTLRKWVAIAGGAMVPLSGVIYMAFFLLTRPQGG